MTQQYSIRWRLLLTSTLVLLVFMGVTGWALDRAYQHSERLSLEERLEARIYALIAVADIDTQGRLRLPDQLTDERFNLPGSGLYAQVADESGGLWQSRSLLVDLPDVVVNEAGQLQFAEYDVSGYSLFVTTFKVIWEFVGDETRLLNFMVAEDTHVYANKVAAFRFQLMLWLGVATIVLLLVQWVMLRWSLSPLNRVASDIAMIESGSKSSLQSAYPKELLPLTNNINALISLGEEQRDRYRHALADLAHSLKTPLAVMQSSFQDGDADKAMEVARKQAVRMRETVDYHLQRASTAGRGVLRQPVAIKPQLDRLAESLNKVYADKDIALVIDIDEAVMWPIDAGDLFEMAGNLMDNAMKWAEHQVRVSISEQAGHNCLLFDDDGVGIAAEDIEKVLSRGGRTDQSVPGQGIGLAVVQDILSAYEGKLQINKNEMGGARFMACFSFQ